MKIDKYFHLYGRKDDVVFEEIPKPEPKWIPCSERLPDKEVLCCDTRGEMIIGYPYQDEESNTEYSAVLDDVVMIDCTAWMPLPEPYEETRRTCETCKYTKTLPTGEPCVECVTDDHDRWEQGD